MACILWKSSDRSVNHFKLWDEIHRSPLKLRHHVIMLNLEFPNAGNSMFFLPSHQLFSRQSVSSLPQWTASRHPPSLDEPHPPSLDEPHLPSLDEPHSPSMNGILPPLMDVLLTLLWNSILPPSSTNGVLPPSSTYSVLPCRTVSSLPRQTASLPQQTASFLLCWRMVSLAWRTLLSLPHCWMMSSLCRRMTPSVLENDSLLPPPLLNGILCWRTALWFYEWRPPSLVDQWYSNSTNGVLPPSINCVLPPSLMNGICRSVSLPQRTAPPCLEERFLPSMNGSLTNGSL